MVAHLRPAGLEGRADAHEGAGCPHRGIQSELDAAAEDETSAEAEAARIRQAKGDIEAERARIHAEADTRAEAVIAEGRARLDREIAELEAKADADIAAAASRSGDELRGEIARLAWAAADRIISDGIDDDTQQRLVEDYIASVGATSPEGARGRMIASERAAGSGLRGRGTQ